MSEDEENEYIGMDIDEVASICEKAGYMTAFFGPDEEVDMEDADESYEWLFFTYDKDRKVTSQIY